MFFYNESDSQVSQVQPTVSDPYFYNTSLLLKMDSDFGDSSVHQHAVTANGNSTISSTESKYGGGSGYFDGSEYINTGIHIPSSDSLDLRGVDWTIEAWIRPDGNYDNWRLIIAKRHIINGDYSYQLYLNKDTGEIRYYDNVNDIGTGVTPTANVWSHLAAARYNGVMTIYLNGIAIGSAVMDTTWSEQPLGIGNAAESTGFQSHPFKGHIDDVRITKGVARYTANFAVPDSHPTTGPSEIVSTDLQLHLDASDTNSYPGSGTTWYDLTSNNLDGTLIDGVTFDSADGGSLVFDASLDYVSIPKTITSVDFTVCQFVKHVSNTNFAWLFSQYKLDGSDVGRLLIQIEPVGSEDKVNFYMGGSSVYGDTSISSGQIYYISCVKAGDNVKIYINGVLDGEGSVPNVAPSNVVCSIGGAPNFPASWRDQTQLIGNVYKTEVYNRALSDAEVLQNFEVTKSRFGL